MNFKRFIPAAFLAVFALTSVACIGPAKVEQIVEIKPNETAFMIKLEGDAKQDQDSFQSVAFLNEHKVATKRVSLPQRQISTGRMWYDYKYIPTAIIITVDRQPVTREWVMSPNGTSTKDQAIHVESKDSVGFGVGVNATGSIPEELASTFLYHYAGKTLEEVMDGNVRGFLQTVLSREFGTRNLSEGRGEKKEIFDTAFKETREYFLKKGISIDYLGSSEGLTYDNKEIQASIDAVFTAERDVEQAKQEKLAQAERNMLLVAKAEAQRRASQEFAMAQSAGVAKTQLEIDMTRANAQLEAAKKWDGKLPANIMPAGSSMLFGLDGNKP